MQKKNFQIAIDGPVGAGKSTVAKLVAERLGILYVDTGAMYRAVALYTKERKIDWEDEKAVSEVIGEVKIELEKTVKEREDQRKITVKLNGKDVSWEIRKTEIGEGASVVSQYKEVRERLVDLQREMVKGKSVIMEGRDIGTKVLVGAELKIYMDATVIERTKRKQLQMLERGSRITLTEAKNDIETRDRREMQRKIDPLKPAQGAWKLDTSKLSVNQVVDKIVEKARKL